MWLYVEGDHLVAIVLYDASDQFGRLGKPFPHCWYETSLVEALEVSPIEQA
jgi:hypothetical protein